MAGTNVYTVFMQPLFACILNALREYSVYDLVVQILTRIYSQLVLFS